MAAPIGFRTGLTEGAVTTRPGTVTVDGGVSGRWSNGITTLRAGEANVRIPFSGRAEVRLYANSYTWRESGGDVMQGREDISIALAGMLVTYRGWRPVTTIIVRLDAPTGSLPGLEQSWRPSIRWSFGWELPGRIAFHSNVGLARETTSAAAFVREFASVWLSHHVAGPVGAYAEALGSSRERIDGGTTGYLHAGLTFLLRPWIHLDVHGGLGSRRAGSPEWLGIGVRQRL